VADNDIAVDREAAAPDLTPSLKRLTVRRRVPLSTYRLQLHKDFTFRDAAAILSYLQRLGVTDCYTSPLLKASPGSRHGYDICDHNQLNPELGSAADYDGFVKELQAQKMGHLLDIVPNHMGVFPDTNPWWWDVLENGPASPYAHFFDIEWDPIKPELRNKVLLPILGDQYGVVLERGELQLVFEDGRLTLRYFEQRVPIDPVQVPRVLRHGLDTLQSELKDDPHLREFLSILTELDHLPEADQDPERIAERQREKEVARDRLSRLLRA
jgi:(1->4)-alpha-D-glucan 1-alpha-D-glucosylmutase